MKLNIFITLTLLLCLALSPCTCRSNDNIVPTETTKAYPPDIAPESSFSFPPSKSPSRNKQTTSKKKEGSDSSQSYTSFSAAFSDIFKGSIRGRTLSMPDHIIDSDKNDNNDKTGMPTNNYQALTEICSHTDYPEICFSTISPFIPRRHFDIMKVLEAAIKACSYQTDFTISKMKKHMERSPELATELATALSDCKEQYSNALENLYRAMEAIPSRDLGTVTVMLSAVMADVSACESGFEDMKKNSPVDNSEGMVSITASNCLAIASLIPS